MDYLSYVHAIKVFIQVFSDYSHRHLFWSSLASDSCCPPSCLASFSLSCDVWWIHPESHGMRWPPSSRGTKHWSSPVSPRPPRSRRTWSADFCMANESLLSVQKKSTFYFSLKICELWKKLIFMFWIQFQQIITVISKNKFLNYYYFFFFTKIQITGIHIFVLHCTYVAFEIAYEIRYLYKVWPVFLQILWPASPYGRHLKTA